MAHRLLEIKVLTIVAAHLQGLVKEEETPVQVANQITKAICDFIDSPLEGNHENN